MYNNPWFLELILYGLFCSLVLYFLFYVIVKSKRIKVLGFVLLGISLLNLLRHIRFYITLVLYHFYSSDFMSGYYFREYVWVFPTCVMLAYAIRLCIIKTDLDFNQYVKTKSFKIFILFYCIAILLECPIFGIHGDFGGSIHGHALWDSGYHFH